MFLLTCFKKYNCTRNPPKCKSRIFFYDCVLFCNFYIWIKKKKNRLWYVATHCHPHECICGDIVWSVKKVLLIKTGFNYIKKYKIKFDLFLQKKAWKEQLFFQRRWGRQSQQTDQVLPSFVVDNFVSSSDLFFCLSCPQSHYIEVAQKGVSKTQLIVNI